MLVAYHKIDGAPSALFDAVAILPGEERVLRLAKLPPARDLVSDAYARYKLVGFSAAAAWLAGVEFSGKLHEIARLILIPLIGFHAFGGLAEHLVFRRDTLIRMPKPERTITKA